MRCMLKRRILLLSTALLPVTAASFRASAAVQAAALSAQDRADLGRIEAYLNGIKTLRAHFTQVAPDGSLSQGTAWMERPGRMRFQYDPPSPYLLIAAHGVLTFNDSALQQTTNIPLGRTPLGILLAEDVKLSGGVTVTALRREGGALEVTLVRTDSPGDGSLTLIFTEPPFALRQWVVVDAQARATRVTLSDVRTGLRFNQQIFDQVTPSAAALNTGD